MDGTPGSDKKKKGKCIEDVVENELLAVLKNEVQIGREARGVHASVVLSLASVQPVRISEHTDRVVPLHQYHHRYLVYGSSMFA